MRDSLRAETVRITGDGGDELEATSPSRSPRAGSGVWS